MTNSRESLVFTDGTRFEPAATEVLQIITLGVGVAVGIAGAFALTRLMSSLLFGVTVTDLTTFVLVSIIYRSLR